MKKTRRFATLLLCAVIAAVFLTGCSNIADFIRGNDNNGNNGNNGNNSQSYTISIERSITNGTVSSNKTSARAGETVVLTVTPSNGYELSTITAAVDSNSVTVNGTGNTRTFIMPANNVTVNAQFTQITYSISVAENIAHGSVTADKSSAAEGETVTLTATPANGYQFSAWNVTAGENETVTVTSGTFSMPAHDVTVSATFTELPPATYSITVTGGTAWANGTSVTSATAGTIITLTASSPQTGYQFSAWNVTAGGSENITVANGTFTMPAQNVTVSATFTAIDYYVSIPATSNGTVTSNKQTAHIGDTVTLTIVPSTGYQLGSVTVNGGSVSANGTGNTRTFTMPASDVTVNATFTAIDYSVSIPTTSNGTVTANKQTAHIGDTVTLTIVPSDGYKLDSISATGATISGTGNTRTFTMPAAAVNVTASFITINIGTKAKPNAVGDIVFNDGTALPASEYQTRNLTNREKQNAIAVVGFVALFDGEPDYAITVGLKQEYLPICSNTSQGYTNSQVFSHDGDAGQTRDDICYGDGGITDYTQANYPAIYWAQNYTGFGNLGSINNDWFIPTQQELLYVYEGKEAIMAAIDKIGSQYADSFIHENHTYYHTVTQFSNGDTHICLVNLEDGNDNYGQYKDSYGPVLVIRYFQCN